MTIYQWIKTRQEAISASGVNSASGLIRALARGMAAAVSGLMFSRVLITIAQILIVRELGPERNGQYGTIATSLGLLASFLGLGLDTWLLNSVARKPEDLARNVWNVVLLKLIGTCGLLAILGLAWSSNTVRTPAFFIGAVGIIFDSFALTCYSALRATRRNGEVALFQTLSPLLLVLVLFTLLLQPGSVTVLLLFCVQAVCSIVISITLMFRLWRAYGPLSDHAVQLGTVVRAAWLFVAADVLANVYTQSIPAFLGWTGDNVAVGLLRPAQNMASFGYLVPNLLFAVSLPLLSAPNLTRQSYFGLLRVMALGALAYGLVAWAGLYFLSRPLIHYLLDTPYEGVAPLVQTLSILPLLKSGSFVCVGVLLSHGQQRLRVLMQCIVVLVCVPAGLLLIPRYGLSAAVGLVLGIEASLFALYALCAAHVLRRRQP